MGAFSPVPNIEGVVDEVMAKAIEPTIAALRMRGVDYRGVLYAGLMLTTEGPKMVEYNVRFGDPESQVVLPRFDGDLAGLLMEAAEGRLRTEPSFVDEAAVCVVLAAPGYPTAVEQGGVIEGLDVAAAMDRVTVFHAGTAVDDEGRFVTAGGRVLNVVGMGSSIEQARQRAYAGAAAITWGGIHYRKDIASV